MLFKRMSLLAIPVALAAGILAGPMTATAAEPPSAAVTVYGHLFSAKNAGGNELIVKQHTVDKPFGTLSARNSTNSTLKLYTGAWDGKKNRCTGNEIARINAKGSTNFNSTKYVGCVQT
ncbi:hypothetical protein [Streptomyces sp. SBT349]|uniref:hypothetical protein n=1 Tax=Streptomyces sp. SBT349 TaxID=1580539 RepID=UPI00066ED872|nr:hypothetical protein [Streptomyces sp. SBT349]